MQVPGESLMPGTSNLTMMASIFAHLASCAAFHLVAAFCFLSTVVLYATAYASHWGILSSCLQLLQDITVMLLEGILGLFKGSNHPLSMAKFFL